MFAAPVAELPAPGDFLTLTVGDYPLIVARGQDGEIRALHNVCRHRGSIICEAAHGTARRRFVCPYHQWSYELDGRLGRARALPDDADPAELGLGAAHCVDIGGLLFVCVADDAPDPTPLRALVEPYLEPFDLGTARSLIARRTSSRATGSSSWRTTASASTAAPRIPS